MKNQILATLSASFCIMTSMSGCSTDMPDDQHVRVGGLEMRLMSAGPSGSTYALAGTFVLDDPESTVISVSETDFDFSVTVSPQVGVYQLELCASASTNPLCSGDWQLFKLECLDPMGQSFPAEECEADPNLTLSATPVAGAYLDGANPQTVDIRLNETSFAYFQFYVPGEGTINFARGNLNIQAIVGEGFPVGQQCTTAVECESKICNDDDGDGIASCQSATCMDGVQNGGEGGPDCGGPCSVLCPGTCSSDADCASGETCLDGLCQAPLFCAEHNDCPAEHYCDAATELCLPAGEGTPCTTDSHCMEGFLCDSIQQVCVL